MNTINMSLSGSLNCLVDEHVSGHGRGSVHAPLRDDVHRLSLRDLLSEGAGPALAAPLTN